jgi:hypothetical protein
MGRHWQVQRKVNTDLYIIVFGSIIGFAVLIALMLYVNPVSQHEPQWLIYHNTPQG